MGTAWDQTFDTFWTWIHDSKYRLSYLFWAIAVELRVIGFKLAINTPEYPVQSVPVLVRLHRALNAAE